MKSLERVLATITTPANARDVLTNLAGIYKLRGADAHLPSDELDEAFRLAGVDKSATTLEQGLQNACSNYASSRPSNTEC